jgi:histidinol-phosphate aminotransferase
MNCSQTPEQPRELTLSGLPSEATLDTAGQPVRVAPAGTSAELSASLMQPPQTLLWAGAGSSSQERTAQDPTQVQSGALSPDLVGLEETSALASVAEMAPRYQARERLPRPIAALQGLVAYRRPPSPELRWRLDANEGAQLADLDGRGLLRGSALRRYPSSADLEQRLAAQYGLAAEQVLVTAGADDGLLRACLAYLGPGRVATLATPTFEMLTRYIALAGGVLRGVTELSGRLPVEGLLDSIRLAGPALGMVAVVTPNNPTGCVASAADLERLSAAAPRALLLVDLAYAEYADEDLTEAALGLPNALVVRTFSKAWGLAAARVGYVLGPTQLLAPLRAAGNPYAVAGPSLALASQRLERDRGPMLAHVARVRAERQRLTQTLRRLGARTPDSKANFVFAEVPDAEFLSRIAARLGLALRRFPGRPELAQALRIGCPDDPQAIEALERAFHLALDPQALIFDMDGVLADVSRSQVAAIQAAGERFGVRLSAEAIAAEQRAGQANCDYALTQRLLAKAGLGARLEDVQNAYEAAYQGGLYLQEQAPLPRSALLELARRWPLAIVTGRPRRDALRFLEQQQLSDCFSLVIAREDAPLKPDPSGVRRALQALGVERAWMFGDTPDDLAAAQAAGVVPIGVVSAGCPTPAANRSNLAACGAALVLDDPAGIPGTIARLLLGR